MDKTTEKLASYAASISYADLTPQAVHAARRSFVDSIGCAFGAYDAEPAKAVRALASRVTSTEPATLIGAGIKTSPELAAFANGVMIRYLDFSDDYFPISHDEAGPHPSDNIGGVLAAAESTGADGKALVLGIVVAYESCAQLLDQTRFSARGWDYTVLHAISTALGAGKVMGLSREQLSNAVSIAVVSNISLRQTRLGELSHWKGCAGPNGSRNGLFAALLAREGITGPPEAFEGEGGFMKQLAMPFELEPFGGNGIPFKIEQTSIKFLPIMYSLQLPVATALELRRKVKIEDIDSISVYLAKRSVTGGSYGAERYVPANRETADHSGPYLIGAALVDGEVTVRTLTPERYLDPAILALTKKIRAVEDPDYTAASPRTLNCRMEATLRSGQKVVVHQSNPKGHPSNPMSDAEIEDKFLKQVEPILPGGRSRILLDRIWDLEKLDSLGQLFSLMLISD